MPKWIRKFEVERSDGKGVWVVSLGDDDTWGCSCPVWRFKRQECKHIQDIQGPYDAGLLDEARPTEKPLYRLANVRKPEVLRVDGKLMLYVPLIRLPDTINMEAVICNAMLRNGYSMDEVREHRNSLKYAGKAWTAKNILAWGEENEWWTIEYPPEPKVRKRIEKRV